MQNESESDTSAKDFWGREAEEAKKKYKAAMSNGRGRQHEMMIEGGCRHYAAEGRASIIKVPEPFRVLRKDRARGIATAVCAGIKDDSFMIPWPVFADMKKIFGRLYVTPADIAEYKVKFTGVILFLDYVSKNAARLDGACSCATRYY